MIAAASPPMMAADADAPVMASDTAIAIADMRQELLILMSPFLFSIMLRRRIERSTEAIVMGAWKAIDEVEQSNSGPN